MIRPLPLGLMALCAAALAACGTPRVVPGPVSSAYTRGEAAAAAGFRDVRVVALGSPFGLDRAALGRLVTGAMPGQVAGVPTRLTTTPGPSAHPDYRVVVAFNPAASTTGDMLRGDAPVPAGPPRDGLLVQAALCRDVGFLGVFDADGPLGAFGLLGGGPLTTATGWLDRAQGPDDPAVTAMLGDVVRTLFPDASERELETD